MNGENDGGAHGKDRITNATAVINGCKSRLAKRARAVRDSNRPQGTIISRYTCFGKR